MSDVIYEWEQEFFQAFDLWWPSPITKYSSIDCVTIGLAKRLSEVSLKGLRARHVFGKMYLNTFSVFVVFMG